MNSDMQHEKEPRKLEEGCSWQKRAVVEDPGMAFGDLSGIYVILGNHLLYSFSFLFKKKSFLIVLRGNFTVFCKELSEMKRLLSK